MAKPPKKKAPLKAKAKPAARTKRKPLAKPRTKPRAKPTAKPRAKPGTRPMPAAARADAHERFDRAAYELPVMDLSEAVELATALLAARPSKATPPVVEEARRLIAARDRARAVLGTHVGRQASTDARAYDVAMDRAWATFVRRVHDHVALPPARRFEAADVARIYSIVRDLSILELNYLAEFAQIGARLDALKREGLLEVARDLVGSVFVDEVLFCHGEYGQALGLLPSATAKSEVTVDRGEARLALVEVIAEYAVQVMAQARAGRRESWPPVTKALRPIGELRALQQRAQRAPRAAPNAHPPVEPRGAAPAPPPP